MRFWKSYVEQTSGSHSSTESEIISLDLRLRLDGIPALDLRDLIVVVLGNTNQNRIEQGDLKFALHFTRFTNASNLRVNNDPDNVDFIR